MEFNFRTIRLFHVEDDDESENAGEDEDDKRTESLASIQLHDDDDREDK
jgi:hypothetical protein